MPNSFPFNQDYVPRVGELVRVGDDYVPVGRAEVISVEPCRNSLGEDDYTVILRGAGRSGTVREFDDRLSYWRGYGIRPDNTPVVGDLITWGTRSANFWVDAAEQDGARTRYELRREGNDPGSLTTAFYSTDMRDVAVLRHGEEQAVPAGDSFYYPAVGDRVRVESPYQPQGLCVVSTVRGAGSSARVTLRPANIAAGHSETEYLSDWRNFGIRLVERYEPARGDFVALDPGFSPEGPQYVSHVDDEGVTLIPLGHGNSRGSGVTHHARSWQSWGIHFLSSTIHEAERRAADSSVDTWRETPASPAGGETTEQEDNMPTASTLDIPAGTRHAISIERAEDFAVNYDHAVYGEAESRFSLIQQTLAAAQEDRDNGALLFLEDGLVLWFKPRGGLGHACTHVLIDTQGVYENSEHPGGTGYDRAGLDVEGFDAHGYDVDGFDVDGFNEDGFNEDGYDRDGYDVEGYDQEGYDSGGCDRYGDSRYDDDCDGRLHSWDYKPTPVFHKTDDDPQPKTFYGVEIELTSDCTSSEMELIKRVGDNENLLYPKSDGSVSGYELNVHPMTWAWATASFPWKMVEDLDNLGSTVDTQENGIHVHVSRDGFSGEVHLFRWMKFVYRNQAHAERIAGRKTDHWAGFREGHMSSQKQHALNQMRMRKQRDREEAGEYYQTRSEYETDNTTASRYSAINTTNAHTVEVRIFASTTNPSVFRQRVGFVAASVEYTRQLNAQAIINGGWDWSAFRTWLLANAETYPDLAAEEEKLLAAEQIRAKSELDAVERRVLRRKWVTSAELMSFAEFIEREQGRQDLIDEDEVSTGVLTLDELRDELRDTLS